MEVINKSEKYIFTKDYNPSTVNGAFLPFYKGDIFMGSREVIGSGGNMKNNTNYVNINTPKGTFKVPEQNIELYSDVNVASAIGVSKKFGLSPKNMKIAVVITGLLGLIGIGFLIHKATR